MYRNTYQIMGDILESTQEEIKITKLMQKTNLPHGRMNKFIDKLCGSGMINKIEVKGKHTFIITEKGRMYLANYKRLSNFTQSFGLEI